MHDFAAIEEALIELPETEWATAASAVLVACVFEDLGMDEDELNAAARRGLLLAAAAGNPAESIGFGSRAALETASDLALDGFGERLAAALTTFATQIPTECPCVVAAVTELAGDSRIALEALAVVVLHNAID